jgi:hypothetical protein
VDPVLWVLIYKAIDRWCVQLESTSNVLASPNAISPSSLQMQDKSQVDPTAKAGTPQTAMRQNQLQPKIAAVLE